MDWVEIRTRARGLCDLNLIPFGYLSISRIKDPIVHNWPVRIRYFPFGLNANGLRFKIRNTIFAHRLGISQPLAPAYITKLSQKIFTRKLLLYANEFSNAIKSTIFSSLDVIWFCCGCISVPGGSKLHTWETDKSFPWFPVE